MPCYQNTIIFGGIQLFYGEKIYYYFMTVNICTRNSHHHLFNVVCTVRYQFKDNGKYYNTNKRLRISAKEVFFEME